MKSTREIRPPQAEPGCAFVWAEKGGKLQHAAISIHPDGSGSITIYRESGSTRVTQQARISLTREGFAVIRQVIDSRLGKACPWTTPDECAMARERSVAGTDAPIPACPEHP